MNDSSFKVLVQCITFNHKDYIEDALNGFCMQKTTFPYVCAILDDYSTDGAQEVIQKYLNDYFALSDASTLKEETDDYVSILTQHKTNKNCYFLVLFLKYNHYQKKSKLVYLKHYFDTVDYIAYCEGDDYWVNSKKLELQVSFLDSHPDYSMCFHGSDVLIETKSTDERRSHQFDGLETREYLGEEVARKWITPTASMVYRSSVQIPSDKRFVAGDIVIRTQCTLEGRVYCFADKMAVYRINRNGLTATPGTFNYKKTLPHLLALSEAFPRYKHIYREKMIRAIRSAILSKNCIAIPFYLLSHPQYIRFILKK